MQQNGRKCLPTDTPSRPWSWVNMSKVYFSEHCHVAYQIKQTYKNLLQTPSPPDPGVLVKRSNFHSQNMVMLHTRLKRIRNAATW